jgi:hypothetical protein
MRSNITEKDAFPTQNDNSAPEVPIFGPLSRAKKLNR